jgi:hypothetical protein
LILQYCHAVPLLEDLLLDLLQRETNGQLPLRPETGSVHTNQARPSVLCKSLEGSVECMCFLFAS